MYFKKCSNVSKGECQLKRVVDAVEFKKALENVYKVNEKQTSATIRDIKVSFKGNQCTVISTNFEQYIVTNVISTGDDFEFLFDGANIKSIMKACKYFIGVLEFDFNEKEHIVKLNSAEKSCTVNCSEIGSYPDVPEVEDGNVYSTNAKVLYSRFNKVKYAVSKVSYLPICTGIYFNKNDLVALDGHRVAINSDINLDVSQSFIVPFKAMNLLGIFGNTEIQIEVDQRFVAFKSTGITVVSRLLAGTYLDYEKVIPKSVSDRYSVDTKQYANALSYLKEFITQDSKQLVLFENGDLTVETTNGVFAAKVKCSVDANIVYCYSAKYMLDAVGQFDSKNIDIQVSGEVNPIMLTDNDSNIALVLPVRRV